MTLAYDRVTERIAAVTGWHPPREGMDFRCPAHEDKRPSLSVSNGDGKVLIHCQTGCDLDAVLDRLQLTRRDLFDQPAERASGDASRIVATYDYVDVDGELLFQVVRKQPKAFSQRRPDGNGWKWSLAGVRRVLYRLPQVVDAVAAGRTVWVVEGEKDVHALEAAGEVATCNPQGAANWGKVDPSPLYGAREIVVVRDKDPDGTRWVADVEASLTGKVGRILVTEARTGKDAADHLGAGHSIDEFDVLSEWAAPTTTVSSWALVDLVALRDGGLDDQPPPVAFTRSDGSALVYAGKIHAFIGESESGKSWGACFACLQEIRAGRHVLYLDFEDDAATVVSRMLAMGARWDELEACFHYSRPDEPLVDRDGSGAGRAELETALASWPMSLAVVDGVTEAMVVHDLDPLSNRDSAKFIAVLIRPLARSGAAVIQVDHVTKDRETRGKFALGAQHKRAAITGAQYTFEATTPLGRGRRGVVSISVEKDKPGHVRSLSNGRKVAELVIASDDTGRTIVAELRPPGLTPDSDAPFRPTSLMEKASRVLELRGALGMTKSELQGAVSGKAAYVALAVEYLVAEGYVTRHEDGRKHLHVSVRPYREDDEDAPTEEEATP